MFAISNKQINNGFILIEMMLCVFLEIIILSFLIEIYLISQQAYDLQQSLVDIEDHAQSAIEILSKEIHQAGYIGCPHLARDFPFAAVEENLISIDNKIKGQANEITLRHASYPASVLLQANDAYQLVISQDIHVKPGNLLIISDCFHAQIVKVQAVVREKDKQIISTTERLKFNYQVLSEVSHLVINRFYVNNHALYMQNINGEKIKLVDHIHHMHFLYTIQNANNLLQIEAQNIANWREVVGVLAEIEIESRALIKKWYVYAKTNV